MRNMFILFFCLLSLHGFGQLLGLVKADQLKSWKIDEYSITYSKKLGPSGAAYYEYDVFKGGKYLSYAAYISDKDSCRLLFREKNNYYISFNLCHAAKTVLRADKAELNAAEIDSIRIRPYDSIRVKGRNSVEEPFYDTIVTHHFDTAVTRSLSRKQINSFVHRWNNAKTNGFDRLGKSYDYLLIIYTKNGIRRIRTLNPFVTENGLWSYETRDAEFFNQLWMTQE